MESAIDISSSSSEAADLREALSRRYVDAIRIMLLSSGRWAIWDMQDGEVRIVESLSEESLRATAEAARSKYERFHVEYDARQERKCFAPTAAPPLTLEDLFG